MIMQVACANEFLTPLIKQGNVRGSIHRSIIVVTLSAIMCLALQNARQLLLILGPKQAALLQPTFPIAAPKYFLYEFKRLALGMLGKHLR